jgi:uncharacterized repeat protein (TIGR01451 family)
MRFPQQYSVRCIGLMLAVALMAGCQSFRLPSIDPTGQRIFQPHPNSTTLLGPCAARNAAGPTQPAFTHPSAQPPCNAPVTQEPVVPPPPAHGHSRKNLGRTGEIILTPSRIIAPVGSEVVVMAGICGNDGYYVVNQPLEWMLAGNSVGHIVEVGGTEHPTINQLLPPTSRKFDGEYAWGRTALKPKTITRGTPTPVDDIEVAKGQHYLTISSPSEGSSYITAVAPKAEAWDKRKATTAIHWIDALWAVPAPSRATSGEPFTLNTRISRASDGTGVPNWKIKYEIIGGTPAEFIPTGAQSAVVTSTGEGQAPIQIRQLPGQNAAGITQIKVDVVRPEMFGDRELVVESGLTSVTWSAPALTIRALGPQSAGVDQPFNYRLEITNPGDQVSRNVIVRTTGLTSDVQFISSNPKPSQYGNQFQWDMGDLAPGATPSVIDIQLKSSKRGQIEVCFEVSSDTDQLRTSACPATLIAAPCIGLEIDGPTTADVGSNVMYNIQVVNQCDEALTNIRLQVQYDEGLAATGLANPIVADIGTLQFGERRAIPLQFSVLTPGTRCFNLSVAADGGHTAAARRCVEASQSTQPQLRVETSVLPATAIVGQRVLARTTITNAGNVPLDNISVLNQYSPSLAIRQATGPTDRLSRNFIGNDFGFTIARLDPNTQQILEIEFECLEADGNAVNRVVVTTPSGVSSTHAAPLRIESGAGGGNPAGGLGARPDPLSGAGLAIDVTTVSSPIRVGNQVRAFQITVANQQNVPVQNVKVTLVIPPGLRFVSIDDSQSLLPVAGQSSDGSQVFLQTRAEMRPRELLTFGVTVVAEQPGQPALEARVESANAPAANDADFVGAIQ